MTKFHLGEPDFAQKYIFDILGTDLDVQTHFWPDYMIGLSISFDNVDR